jgi:hypothetical protein
MRGRPVRRVHGGNGCGPKGDRNSAFQTGRYTTEVKADRRDAPPFSGTARDTIAGNRNRALPSGSRAVLLRHFDEWRGATLSIFRKPCHQVAPQLQGEAGPALLATQPVGS